MAYGQKSFPFEAARMWNSLQNELRKVSTSRASRGLSALGLAQNATVLYATDHSQPAFYNHVDFKFAFKMSMFIIISSYVYSMPQTPFQFILNKVLYQFHFCLFHVKIK